MKGNFVTEAVEISGGDVDLSSSNVFVLKNIGGNQITLRSMVSGGHYTLIVEDLEERQYSFNGCQYAYYNPASAKTIADTQTIFGITTIRVNNQWRCYITWSSGYQ